MLKPDETDLSWLVAEMGSSVRQMLKWRQTLEQIGDREETIALLDEWLDKYAPQA